MVSPFQSFPNQKEIVMKQTAGKVFAREYFYQNFLPSFLPPRQLRRSNVLTLLGEDFRELSLLEALGVPPYQVFSVEKDLPIFQRQRARNRRDEMGVALHYGELAEYIHSHLPHTGVSVFNLDICGSFLKAIDPVLGKLLLYARRNPNTVMATYSSAGRDRPQLMEGLKSLVILWWLMPEVIDRLVRQIYSQYRSATLAESEMRRNEVSRNMLLRHLFWLRSHMEHVMIGSHVMGATSESALHEALDEQESIWRQFLDKCSFPLTYQNVMDVISTLPRPEFGSIRMDISFGDVEFLTYAANDGFYHNCYFATYECDGSTVSLDTWLVESAKTLRSHDIVLVDSEGKRYPSTYGRVAVNTDNAVLWSKADVKVDLRRFAVPPSTSVAQAEVIERLEEEPTGLVQDEFTPDTIEHIRQLARNNPSLSAQEIADRLSLRLPIARITAHVAVGRRKPNGH